MNYQKRVILFNVFFLSSLLGGTVIFHFFPSLGTKWFRPVNIISEITQDSINNSITITEKQDKKIKNGFLVKDYLTANGLINSSGSEYALGNFLNKLAGLKKRENKKVRIGYFGDSMIEGDLITQDLRKSLQDTFGGVGVGFVPITSIVAGFRQTIIHSFSKNWNEENFKSDNKATAQLFLSGHKYLPADNSWVSYKAVNQPHLDNFSEVQILFGKPQGSENLSAEIKLNNQVQMLTATDIFNIKEINLGSCKEATLTSNATGMPLYGMSFESDSGVFVDNFSFRGISGVELDNLSEGFFAKIQAKRLYDLLVFHYGANLLFKGELVDFKWYQKKMIQVLMKIKKAFPQTSILIISTADKGYKYAGEWRTQKGVKPLTDVQYTLANDAGFDFFNLYNAMGGEGTMIKWVNENPSFANKDYTHANFRGAKKLADIIFNALIKEFDDYQKHSN